MLSCDFEYRHAAFEGLIGADDFEDAAASAIAAARDDVVFGGLEIRCTRPGLCGHPSSWTSVRY